MVHRAARRSLLAASCLVFGRISISLRFSSVVRLDFQQVVSFFPSRRMLKITRAPCVLTRRVLCRQASCPQSGWARVWQEMLIADGKTGSRAFGLLHALKQRKTLSCKPLTERTSQQIEVEASRSPTWLFARRSHRRDRPRGLNYEIE